VARELLQGITQVESVKAKLEETRDIVRSAWWAVSEILIRDNHSGLAAEVKQFAERMPPPMTEQERLVGTMVERSRPPRRREGPSR